jgi:uncharacterized membrane protein YccC
MATILHHHVPFARTSAWFRSFDELLKKEFSPSRRRLVNSVRLATIGTVGAGLMAALHVDTALGPYLVWLMIGAAPMLSLLKAFVYLIAEAPLLVASVPIAGVLAETPWLMLPFIFGFTALSTQQVVSRKLGPFGLVMQVVALDTFYAVVFAPDDFGWGVSSVFGASVIAFFLIAIFDRILWPDPAEALLLDSIATSTENNRVEFLQVARFYLDGSAALPLELSVLSQLPTQLALLNNAAAEGMAPHRRAILLAAATREERVYTEISKLAISARENVPRQMRATFRTELDKIIDTLAAAIQELAREAKTNSIRTGPDSGPSRVAARAQAAFDALDQRIAEERPKLTGTIGVLETGNFNAFCDTLHEMMRLIERPLDEAPASTSAASDQRLFPKAPPVDQALARYSAKVALCMVIGYFIGLTTQRADLSVILTTIVITALPTYGAAARKMVLRLVGTILGGVVTILTIMIVTPNFETLPSYLVSVFVVLLISGYASLGSGRTSYAGKSIGTTFLLVFGAGLSPSSDVYGPLWRIWGILLGTMVVTVIFFLLWPEYAGDSLLPRVCKALQDAIDLAPGGAASATEERLHTVNHDLTQVMVEILQVGDDARMEGRKSLVDPDSVVNAAGTIRRVAHRLAALSANQLSAAIPPLDAGAEDVRAQVIKAIVTQLESWLAFFNGSASLNSKAARTLAAAHTRDRILTPLELLSSRLSADNYGCLLAFTTEQRRQVLAELQSFRRLEFLMSELNEYLARVPGTPGLPVRSLALTPST